MSKCICEKLPKIIKSISTGLNVRYEMCSDPPSRIAIDEIRRVLHALNGMIIEALSVSERDCKHDCNCRERKDAEERELISKMNHTTKGDMFYFTYRNRLIKLWKEENAV